MFFRSTKQICFAIFALIALAFALGAFTRPNPADRVEPVDMVPRDTAVAPAPLPPPNRALSEASKAASGPARPIDAGRALEIKVITLLETKHGASPARAREAALYAQDAHRRMRELRRDEALDRPDQPDLGLLERVRLEKEAVWSEYTDYMIGEFGEAAFLETNDLLAETER